MFPGNQPATLSWLAVLQAFSHRLQAFSGFESTVTYLQKGRRGLLKLPIFIKYSSKSTYSFALRGLLGIVSHPKLKSNL
jgi:hypothetical protein